MSPGVGPQLVLSGQMLDKRRYQSHEDVLPYFEKRMVLMSAKYREMHRAWLIEIVSAATE
jgi:hypothetical protein